MAQARMRVAKTPMTRQNATHRLNANKLSTVQIEETLAAYPAPEWMGDKAKKLWVDCIRSYSVGQFKKYNMPILEQYVLVIQNLNRLTRRIGHGTGLVKPRMNIGEDGEVETITMITREYQLYRSMVVLLGRLSQLLHMPPRPYVMMSSSESETLDEEIRGNEGQPDVAVYTPGNRNTLLGGRRQTYN